MSTDRMQFAIDRIFESSDSYEQKIKDLQDLEHSIEFLYAHGLTTVKPCIRMTADDLIEC